MSRGRNYLLAIILSSCVFQCWAAVRGIRPTVNISPANARVRKNPKIKASDVEFDLKTARLNRGMAPTLDRLANEIAILVNNLYKRRELDEVNVRSLMRIRFYLAAVYRQTKQRKLKARIEEAVREINEELRHRLDFEERYKSGLIKIPTGNSTRTMSTQTASGVGGEEERRITVSHASSSAGPEDRLPASAALSSGVVSKMRAAAQRARDKVAEKRAADRANLPGRQRALLDLVESGKININQLTKKDRDFVNAYRSNPSSVASFDGGQQGSKGPGMIPQTIGNISSEAPPSEKVSRANLPARQRALLDLVESGKIDENQLTQKDRILVNAYRNNPSSMMNTDSRQQESRDPRIISQSPLEAQQMGVRPVKVERADLPARQRALLDLVESGKMNINQLSPKDRVLVNEYLFPLDISKLPPRPPELLKGEE
jgi:hypothetical protein